MKKIVFTVTNDLSYDQRMIRICSSLSAAGYQVLLVGRKLPASRRLSRMSFSQARLSCIFHKGFLFYAEYNIRLFFYLLFTRTDAICAIDLDTILPCLFVSVIKNKPRIYDAHELFCEMKEIVARPRVYRIWKRIERFSVPKFGRGYTVNDEIAAEFARMYRRNYAVVRNIPLFTNLALPVKNEIYILYQGSVNEGRCFETLIPAMKMVHSKLIICGDGNFMEQTRKLVSEHNLRDKIIFTGKLPPEELKKYTLNATAGVTLFDDVGLSNYFSLANRFFDYMHAGIPQVCVDYPVYRSIVTKYPFALLIADTQPATIADALNKLLRDRELYLALQKNCLEARRHLNWQEEEKKLVSFYHQIFSPVE